MHTPDLQCSVDLIFPEPPWRDTRVARQSVLTEASPDFSVPTGEPGQVQGIEKVTICTLP
jgi:hypothetical protein